MPEMPDDTPWWAWLIVAVLIVVVPAIVTWLMQRGGASKLDHVVAETSPNHGGSMKDRTEQIVEMVDAVQKDVTSVQKDVGGLRAETRELFAADRSDREAALEAHKQIYDAMAVDRARVEALHKELLAAIRTNTKP